MYIYILPGSLSAAAAAFLNHSAAADRSASRRWITLYMYIYIYGYIYIWICMDIYIYYQARSQWRRRCFGTTRPPPPVPLLEDGSRYICIDIYVHI